MLHAARRIAELMLAEYGHEGRFAVRPEDLVDVERLEEAFISLGCRVERSHRPDEFDVICPQP